MPKVTVLMPSLNVVKYISPCMESVIAQTLHDIEILVIDAGSDDGTLEILRGYEESDLRVKIIHSDRKSYGYQINLGISLAKGEYVGIVETDDLIMPDMYEILYNTAVKTEAQYVKGRCMRFVEVREDICWNQPVSTPLPDGEMLGNVVEPRNMPELLVKDIYLWTGIYKKEFIGKIRLNETPGAAFQDQGFLFQTISSASKAVYLDKIVYQYRQNNSNSSIFNKNGFRYLVEEYAFIEKFLADKDDNWKCAYYTRMFNQCMGRFDMMALSGAFWYEADQDIEILRGRLTRAVEGNILMPTYIEKHRWALLEIFLKEAKDVYSYCLGELQKKAAPTFEMMNAINHHQVIIFCCGRYGKFFHAILESKCPGLAVAYCDNNDEFWDAKTQGLRVLSPEMAVKQYPEAVYVIANLGSAQAIRRQLNGMGIMDQRICFYHEPENILLFHMKLM